MPIYEYVCSECNLKFELLRPLSQAKEVACCPHCQHGAKRAFSSFAPFSKSSSGESIPIGGSSPCITCSAMTCNTCQK